MSILSLNPLAGTAQTILQEWVTPEIICQMPLLSQPSQLTHALDQHWSILVSYPSGMVLNKIPTIILCTVTNLQGHQLTSEYWDS